MTDHDLGSGAERPPAVVRDLLAAWPAPAADRPEAAQHPPPATR
jgi:hypothetical protein